MNTKAIITNYIRSSFPWNAITLKNFASCTNAWAPLSKIDIKHTTDEAEFRRTVIFNKSTSKANIGNTNQTLKSEIKVSSPSIDGKITAKLSSRHLNVWLGLISSSSQAGPSSFSGKVNCTSVHGNSTRGNFGLTNVRVNPQLVVKPQNPAKAEAKPRFAPISSKVSTHTADSNLEKPTDTYSTNDNVNRTFPTHSRNHKRRFTDTFEHYHASYSHQKCVKPTIYGPYHLTANKIYQIWQCIPFNVKIQRMPDDIWSYFPRFSTLDAEIVEEFNSQDLGLLFKRLKWNLTVSEKYFLDKGFKLIFDRDSQVCGFAMTQYHQFRQIPIYTIYLALIRALIMARFHLQDPLKKHHNSKSWKFVFQSGSNVRTLEMSTGSINRFYRYVDLLSDLVQSNEFEFEKVKRIMNQQKSVKVNTIAPMKSIKDDGLNAGCWNLQDLKIQEETSRVHKNLSFGQEYYIGFLRYTTAITDPYLVRHFTADVQTPKKTEQCVIKKVNVPISDGSTVECAWFTNLNEDNLDSYDITILYFHGGGYIWGNSLMYSKSYETLLLNLKLQNKRARIFSGTYPLAPESVFPAQLNASVDVYKWLLANPSVRPESIVLAGESAGAHLALTLLFSLHKQNVELPSACVTISPVVDMTQTFETFPNNLTDYLAKESAASVPNYYLGANDSSSLRKNELVSPILASDKLLKGVFTKSNLKKYLVAYGGQEVFSPEIKRWISRIEGLLTGVMDVDCDPDMVHIYQLLPEAFPTHAVNGIERIAKWIVSVL